MNATRLAAMGLVLAFATAAAAAILSASVKRLSVGTSFGVDGSGFRRNPSAWLEVGARKIPLKMHRRGTDAHIDFTLTTLPQGVHGDCVLRIRPTGTKVPFTFAGLSIELPSVGTTVPASAAPETEVTIDGNFFGTKRGRVTFGGRRGKVTSWSDSQIKVVVPSGLASGGVYLLVENRAGASQAMVVFTIL